MKSETHSLSQLLHMYNSPYEPLLLAQLSMWQLSWIEMLTFTHTHSAGTGSTDSSTDTSTTDISARVTGVDKATATELCDAPHRWHADWKALAAAEACTDLRLPWLNRERGSCFFHGQKESAEGGSPPLHGRGGATATPANQHLPEQEWGLKDGGGCVWGAVAKEPHCNPAHTQTHTHTRSLSERFYAETLSAYSLMWDKERQPATKISQYIRMKNQSFLFWLKTALYDLWHLINSPDCSIKMLWWHGAAEHLPDAVTIVTMLHFLSAVQWEMERDKKGGAEEEGRGKSVPLGTEGDSFSLNLGTHRHIMCLCTLTHEQPLPLLWNTKGQ